MKEKLSLNSKKWGKGSSDVHGKQTLQYTREIILHFSYLKFHIYVEKSCRFVHTRKLILICSQMQYWKRYLTGISHMSMKETFQALIFLLSKL